MEKFVSMTDYDPEVAKEDKSAVFQEVCVPFRRCCIPYLFSSKFQARFDLLQQYAEETNMRAKGRGVRTTRRAVNERREGLGQRTPVSASPKPDRKGKSPAEPASRRISLPAKVDTATPKSAKAKGKGRKSLSAQIASSTPGPSKTKPTPPSKKRPGSPAPSIPAYLRSKKTKIVHKGPPVYTNPYQLPLPSTFGGSLSELLTSYHHFEDDPEPLRDDLETRISAEAALADRIAACRREGRLLEPAGRHQQLEPGRKKDHQDHLVEQACSMAEVTRDRREDRLATSRKIAKMVADHLRDIKGFGELSDKDLEKLRKAGARNLSRDIRKKWKLAVNVRSRWPPAFRWCGADECCPGCESSTRRRREERTGKTGQAST
jgi:helicase SWR1